MYRRCINIWHVKRARLGNPHLLNYKRYCLQIFRSCSQAYQWGSQWVPCLCDLGMTLGWPEIAQKLTKKCQPEILGKVFEGVGLVGSSPNFTQLSIRLCRKCLMWLKGCLYYLTGWEMGLKLTPSFSIVLTFLKIGNSEPRFFPPLA